MVVNPPFARPLQDLSAHCELFSPCVLKKKQSNALVFARWIPQTHSQDHDILSWQNRSSATRRQPRVFKLLRMLAITKLRAVVMHAYSNNQPTLCHGSRLVVARVERTVYRRCEHTRTLTPQGTRDDATTRRRGDVMKAACRRVGWHQPTNDGRTKERTNEPTNEPTNNEAVRSNQTNEQHRDNSQHSKGAKDGMP